MPILELTLHPHTLLRSKLREVPPHELHSSAIQKLIDQMIETMFAKNGVGLAANQVGRDIQIAIISTQDGPVAVINPRIVRKSFRKEVSEEGCLSIPGLFGMVKRHQRVTLEALDRHGKRLRMEGKGLLARVIQHELDHLNGFLCIDRMSKVTHGTMPDGRKKI